jgi:hypothetical protein
MKVLRAVVVFAAILAIVLPAFAVAPATGCKHECRRGTDATGTAFAHCVEYFFGSWYMSGCREVQYCYWMLVTDDSGTHYVKYCLSPDCDGGECYMV